METLGTKFKSAREKIGISLEKASEITKIRIHILKSFEDGNFSVLPPVYTKSFVVSYAKSLNISMADIEEEIEELFPTKQVKVTPVKTYEDEEEEEGKRKKVKAIGYNLPSDSKSKIINIVIYSVIVIAFGLIFYFSFFTNDDDVNEGTSASDTTSVEDTASIGVNNIFSFYEEPDSVILQAKAIDSAWLKINIDGKISEQSYMVPNLEKRWSAKDYFLITLGNAGAVEFKRNGEPLPKLGPPGSVVRNIKITATEITNSSNPWGDSTKKKPRRRWRKKKKEEIKALEPTTIEKNEKDILNRLKESQMKKPEFFRPKNNALKPIKPIPKPVQQEAEEPPEEIKDLFGQYHAALLFR